MLKIAGAAVIVFAAAMTGNYFAESLNRRLKLLKAVNRMIDEIIVLLRYKAADVYEISAELSKNDELAFIREVCLSALDNRDIPFSQCWTSAVYSDKLNCSHKSERDLIAEIGRKLGTSDMEGQLSSLMLEKNEAAALISSAENDCTKKVKLYRSLGLLSGIFAVLLIL